LSIIIFVISKSKIISSKLINNYGSVMVSKKLRSGILGQKELSLKLMDFVALELLKRNSPKK